MNWGNYKVKVIFVSAIAVVLTVILFIVFQGGYLFSNSFSTINFVHHLVWFTVLMCSMLIHFKKDLGKAVRFLALWIGIAAALFIGYSFKDHFLEFGANLKAELIPHAGKKGPNQITFRARVDGQFLIEAAVNGYEMKFIFDTGATDVMLTPKDAKRIGFKLNDLSFDKIYLTANGVVKAAPVSLREIKIGPIEVKNVRASVNDSEMGYSLLGMSFLSSISGYEVVGDKLTLKR